MCTSDNILQLLTRPTWKIGKVFGWKQDECVEDREQLLFSSRWRRVRSVSWPRGPRLAWPHWVRPSTTSGTFSGPFSLLCRYMFSATAAEWKGQDCSASGERRTHCVSVVYYHRPHYPTIWTAGPFWSEDEAHRSEPRCPFPIMTHDCGGEAGEQTSHTFWLIYMWEEFCAVHRRRRRHYVPPAWAAEERRLKNTKKKVRDSIMRCEVRHVASSSSSSSSSSARLLFFSYRMKCINAADATGFSLFILNLQSSGENNMNTRFALAKLALVLW